MQGPEEKKRTARHAAPEPELARHDDAIRADTDLYGDEADIPIRSRKPKKKTSAKKTPKASGVKKSTPKRDFKLFAVLSDSDATHLHKNRALFEIVRTSGDNAKFKALLFNGRRISIWPLVVLVILFAAVALVFMNNTNVSVAQQQVTVVGLPVDLENYKMLVVSDLNGRRFGDKQSALLRTINNLDYDSILFLGDMVGKGGDPEPFYEILDGIPSSKEMYFICGDSDPGPLLDVPRSITGTLSQLVFEDWILGAIERGAVYVDSPTALTVGNSTVWLSPSTLMTLEASDLLNTWKEQTEQEEDGVISGLAADYQTLPLTSYRYRVAQNYYNTVDSIKEEDFHLILSHTVPSDESIYAMAAHDSFGGKYLPEAELILAGHYCGGVWRLPMLGAFYIPDNMLPRNGWFPDQEDAYGLSTIGESQVYITGGLSVNSQTPFMPFRLFNQPQLSVLTLTATLPENMLSAQ